MQRDFELLKRLHANFTEQVSEKTVGVQKTAASDFGIDDLQPCEEIASLFENILEMIVPADGVLGETLPDLRSGQTRGVERAHDGPDAGPCHGGRLDAALVDGVERENVRQAASPSAAQRDAETPGC